MFASLDQPVDPGRRGAAQLAALSDYYESVHGACALYEFEPSGAGYLFDLAGGSGLPQEDRTVAARTVAPESISRRDAAYPRGFPIPPDSSTRPSTGDISSLTSLVESSGPTSSGRTRPTVG
ncbi:MAG TPA: hypothetical protein VM388_00235 [Acidimicrobiales bacterium]|nr:hypothetical protein [Acidimicrobiales bacterium]